MGVLVILAAVGAALFVFGTDDDDRGPTRSPPPRRPTPRRRLRPRRQTTASPATTAGSGDDRGDRHRPHRSRPKPHRCPTTTATAIWPWVDTRHPICRPGRGGQRLRHRLSSDSTTRSPASSWPATAGRARSRSEPIDTGPCDDGVRPSTHRRRQLVDHRRGEREHHHRRTRGVAEIDEPTDRVGNGLAFEGTVDVQLRADGNGEPIFEGFVTGSGGPNPGPYSEHLRVREPWRNRRGARDAVTQPERRLDARGIGAADLLSLIVDLERLPISASTWATASAPSGSTSMQPGDVDVIASSSE